MHPLMLDILVNLGHDEVIKGKEILKYLRYSTEKFLDGNKEYILELEDMHYVHIVFTGATPEALYPGEEDAPAGEFLAENQSPWGNGLLGVIFVHETPFEQEILAHEVFHALELLAQRKEPDLLNLRDSLWGKSLFPEDHYASWGGPGEGSAEVFRAHLGHYGEDEEGALWVLEEEWAEYFDKVLAHCF